MADCAAPFDLDLPPGNRLPVRFRIGLRGNLTIGSRT